MTKQKQTAANSPALAVRIGTESPPDHTPPDRAPIAFLAGAIAGAAGMFALGAHLGRKHHTHRTGPCDDTIDFPPGPPYESGDADDPFANHFGPFYEDPDDDTDERGD